MKARIHLILLLLCTLLPICSHARLNDKVLNRPYADLRPWHLGFSVGLHTQSLVFTHTGEASADGSTWFLEQPSYSPGFCVNALASLRLNPYFSLRAAPGLYFGNRDLRMIDSATGATERQNLKSTMIVLPFDLQYHAMRLRNFRPYMAAGIMPAFDVTKRTGELIQLKSSDMYLTVSIGADFYLKYFKLIPEVKFCFGLKDILQHDRPDLTDDPYKLQFTQSLRKATSRLIVLTFYFE